MKRLLLILFVCTTATSFSQEIKYGVRGSLNISSLNFDTEPEDIENKQRTGFAFAGFVDFGLTEDIAFRTELQWSAEGGKDESLRADYIQLPVMIRFNTSDRFSIGAGPQFNLKTWKNNDGFTTFTFSGVVGAEYMITSELFIDVRYTYGFSNIFDDDITDLEATNNVIQFGFGVKI